MRYKNKNCFRDIKKLLVDLGFHHCWGYWILNQNKEHRIIINKTKNRIYLDMTKKRNHFDLNNDMITIDKKNIDLDIIKNRVVQYFNIKKNRINIFLFFVIFNKDSL